MADIIFGSKIDLSAVDNPGVGGHIIAYDLDGILKQKDEFGNITVIGATESIIGTLQTITDVGSDTTNDITIKDNGKKVVISKGDITMFDNTTPLAIYGSMSTTLFEPISNSSIVLDVQNGIQYTINNGDDLLDLNPNYIEIRNNIINKSIRLDRDEVFIDNSNGGLKIKADSATSGVVTLQSPNKITGDYTIATLDDLNNKILLLKGNLNDIELTSFQNETTMLSNVTSYLNNLAIDIPNDTLLQVEIKESGKRQVFESLFGKGNTSGLTSSDIFMLSNETLDTSGFLTLGTLPISNLQSVTNVGSSATNSITILRDGNVNKYSNIKDNGVFLVDLDLGRTSSISPYGISISTTNGGVSLCGNLLFSNYKVEFPNKLGGTSHTLAMMSDINNISFNLQQITNNGATTSNIIDIQDTNGSVNLKPINIQITRPTGVGIYTDNNISLTSVTGSNITIDAYKGITLNGLSGTVLIPNNSPSSYTASLPNKPSGNETFAMLSDITLNVTIIDVTKSELDTLIATQSLDEGVKYRISGCDTSLYGGTTLILKAVSNKEVSEDGVGIFYNPKYDQNVLGFNIWDINNIYIGGNKVHWGGRTWTNNTGVVGTASDIFTLDPVNWTPIVFNSTDYDEVYDVIKYDYQNDQIIYRNEGNSNIVSTNVENISKFINTFGLYNPIKVFQWGNLFNSINNNGIGNQYIENSYNENINFRGISQTNIRFINGSYQTNVNFDTLSSQNSLTFIDSSQYDSTYSSSVQYRLNFRNSKQFNITATSSNQSELNFERSQQNNMSLLNSIQSNMRFINSSQNNSNLNTVTQTDIYITNHSRSGITSNEIGGIFGNNLPNASTASNIVILENNQYKSISGNSFLTSNNLIVPRREVPIGSTNGSNTIFNLSFIPVDTNAVILTLNGVVRSIGTDFTISSTTITFTFPPTSGSEIVVYYHSGSPSTVTESVVNGLIRPLPFSTGGNSSAILFNNILYIQRRVGTATFVGLNLETNTYQTLATASFTLETASGGSTGFDDTRYIYTGRGGTTITNNFYRYDINTNSWATMAAISLTQSNITIGTGNGSNTAFGLWFGKVFTGVSITRYASVTVFVNGIPQSPTVTTTTGAVNFSVAPGAGAVVSATFTLRQPMGNTGAMPFYNGNLYCLLGGDTPLFWRYNITLNTWVNLADAPAGCDRCSLAKEIHFISGVPYIYALRGENDSGTDTSDFWRYNINTNTWSVMSSLPIVVDSGSLAIAGDWILCSPGRSLFSFFAYNIPENIWTEITPLDVVMSSGSITIVKAISKPNHFLVNYIIIGGVSNTALLSNWITLYK